MPSLPVLTSSGSAAADRDGDAGGGAEAIAARLAVIAPGQVRFDRHTRQLYSTDASLYQVEPIGVFIPSNVDCLGPVLAYCAARGVAVLPRGGS